MCGATFANASIGLFVNARRFFEHCIYAVDLVLDSLA
jgi:hypothetical protein